MKSAYEIAANQSNETALRNEKIFNRRARSSVLSDGDRVLIRNLRERDGPGKLRSFWEDVVYRIVERKGEGPVYVIEPERGGERRTVHRNLLFHCSEELPDAPVVEPKSKKKVIRKKVEVQRKEDTHDQDDSSESDDGSTDSEDSEPPTRRNAPRARRKPTTLNYGRLGTPSINSVQVNNQSASYKMWLQQLWMIGLITDHIIKQSKSQPKSRF